MQILFIHPLLIYFSKAPSLKECCIQVLYGLQVAVVQFFNKLLTNPNTNCKMKNLWCPHT